MNVSFEHLLTECDRLGINGLLFQHIHLCPTRTWLHYHRIDCSHLNRHMQAGLLLHATAYGGRGAHSDPGFGLSPDVLDVRQREISEVKKSNSHEHASIAQLRFYLAVMEQASGQRWTGVLRYPDSRRTKRITLDAPAQIELLEDFTRIQQVITQPQPPPKVDKPICKHCAYRMLCWQQSTEDWDY
jgi:CRISPR-associated exonuclease Cas4